jgi:lysophospholipase L1-like esterase
MIFSKSKIAGLICLIMGITFFSCESDNEATYCAIGDSLIARWDIGSNFPSHQFYNLGLSGSGIDYLEQKRQSCAGKITFVLSGTNDLSIIRTDMSAYIDRYLTAIENLGGKSTYIISLLPRNFDSDGSDFNEIINRFNAQVKEEVVNHPALHYIDVHDAFTEDGTMNGQLSYDGLHLNEYGYEILSSILKDYIQ